jgi:hypothetical protein
MAPADQTWWWYWGPTADQVGQLLAQNKARLTDISAYGDVDGTLKFAVIMAPADQTWWWYWGPTADQVGQLLAQNKARLTVLTPYLTPLSCTMGLDSFEITNTRSRHEDTDFVSVSVTVGTRPPQTQTRSLGDLNNGTFPLNMVFPNLQVWPNESVTLNYVMVNNGHQDPNAVEKGIEQLSATLAQKAAAAAATAVGVAVGAALGASIGTAIVPLLGTALGALAGWVTSEFWGFIFADCDGPVAAAVHVLKGFEILAAQRHGGMVVRDEHPGVDSPAGCGSNSHYFVTWSVH